MSVSFSLAVTTIIMNIQIYMYSTILMLPCFQCDIAIVMELQFFRFQLIEGSKGKNTTKLDASESHDWT